MTNTVMLIYKTVKISDLKAQLSAHIKLVREGEEVLVCDRGKPVVRIVPCNLDEHTDQEQRLIARGALIPPKRRDLRCHGPNQLGMSPMMLCKRYGGRNAKVAEQSLGLLGHERAGSVICASDQQHAGS